MSGIVGGNLGRGSGLIKAGAIDDNSVTLAKMAGLARGTLIHGDTSGDPAALAVGGADEVLTHDGTDFDWAAAGGGVSASGGSFYRDKATASGTQAITGVGFTPKCGTFWSTENVKEEMSIGWQGAAGTTESNSLSSYYFYAAGTIYSYSGSGKCLRNDEAAATYYHGYISSWDADGFTVTWTRGGTPTGNMYVGYLVMG